MPATRQHVHGRAGTATQDAAGPPAHGIPGLDPRWSRVVVAPDAEGVSRSWHVLDTGPLLADRGELDPGVPQEAAQKYRLLDVTAGTSGNTGGDA